MKLPLMIKRLESRNLPSEQFDELILRFISRGSSSKIASSVYVKKGFEKSVLLRWQMES